MLLVWVGSRDAQLSSGICRRSFVFSPWLGEEERRRGIGDTQSLWEASSGAPSSADSQSRKRMTGLQCGARLLLRRPDAAISHESLRLWEQMPVFALKGRGGGAGQAEGGLGWLGSRSLPLSRSSAPLWELDRAPTALVVGLVIGFSTSGSGQLAWGSGLHPVKEPPACLAQPRESLPPREAVASGHRH